jgi:hypothetical protein
MVEKIGIFHLEKLHLLQNFGALAEEVELTLEVEVVDMFKLHFLAAAERC